MTPRLFLPVAILAIGSMLMTAAPLANAHGSSGVSWSVSIGTAAPATSYYGPPPGVYMQPYPVYVQPPTVYVQPHPVYVPPQPVYVAPPPLVIYSGPGYIPHHRRYYNGEAANHRHFRHHNPHHDWHHRRY